MTCKCCGKLWKDGSRGLDAAKRQCASRAGCLTRALGPTKGKSEAKRLRKEQAGGP
jgi:hypothetical protein